MFYANWIGWSKPKASILNCILKRNNINTRLKIIFLDAYTPRIDTDDIDNDKTRCIRSSEVTPALRIGLSLSELRLLEAYSPKMKRIGIKYTLSEDSAMVTHLPACVVEKEANELKRGRQTIATSTAEVRLTITYEWVYQSNYLVMQMNCL